MRNCRLDVVIFLFAVVLFVVSCRADPTPTPVPMATGAPTPTLTQIPFPTDTPEPTATSVPPTRTPFPTPAEEAPDETFTRVGNVAHLDGQHAVSGKATVAGLQTLIIQSFTFDGKGPKADIRLVQGQNYADLAAVLLELERRPYEEEFLRLIIPSSVGPDDADSIAVYCEETGEVYAAAKFQ